jgi:uncharacterized protein YndB with AHSA1/START domain
MDDRMIVETTADRVRLEVGHRLPPMQAWPLRTEKQHIANRWGAHVDLQARPGSKLLERWSAGGLEVLTSGVVTRCDPAVVLEMTWADDEQPADTRLGFRVSEHRDSTRHVLDHSGWSVQPVDGSGTWRVSPATQQRSGRASGSMAGIRAQSWSEVAGVLVTREPDATPHPGLARSFRAGMRLGTPRNDAGPDASARTGSRTSV